MEESSDTQEIFKENIEPFLQSIIGQVRIFLVGSSYTGLHLNDNNNDYDVILLSSTYEALPIKYGSFSFDNWLRRNKEALLKIYQSMRYRNNLSNLEFTSQSISPHISFDFNSYHVDISYNQIGPIFNGMLIKYYLSFTSRELKETYKNSKNFVVEFIRYVKSWAKQNDVHGTNGYINCFNLTLLSIAFLQQNGHLPILLMTTEDRTNKTLFENCLQNYDSPNIVFLNHPSSFLKFVPFTGINNAFTYFCDFIVDHIDHYSFDITTPVMERRTSRRIPLEVIDPASGDSFCARSMRLDSKCLNMLLSFTDRVRTRKFRLEFDEIEPPEESFAYFEYESIYVKPETEKFQLVLGRLLVSTLPGNWSFDNDNINNQFFTTNDADNDNSSDNCAVRRKYGFWFNNSFHLFTLKKEGNGEVLENKYGSP
ncbi:hypothetical protein SNEBB_006684 [Seison nebaliae]|nr:hypothetical protein SNEBB_006684 [Seison nebaliae]